MNILFRLVVCFVLIGSSPSLFAQQLDIFSGHGVKDSMMGKQTTPQATSSRWPSLKDFSLGEPPRLFNFGGDNVEDRPLAKLFSSNGPNLRWFQPKDGGPPALQFGNGQSSGLSNLFSRTGERPKFLEQFNARSKAFVDRTTDWAQRQNDNIRARTFGTWDAITRGLNRNAERVEEVRPSAPAIRTANTPDGRPKIKF